MPWGPDLLPKGPNRHSQSWCPLNRILVPSAKIIEVVISAGVVILPQYCGMSTHIIWTLCHQGCSTVLLSAEVIEVSQEPPDRGRVAKHGRILDSLGSLKSEQHREYMLHPMEFH